MGSGSPIDDLVKSGTLRLLHWNDSMTDIQLGMRFVDKVQTISTVRNHLVANDPEIPVSNVIEEVQVIGMLIIICSHLLLQLLTRNRPKAGIGSSSIYENILSKIDTYVLFLIATKEFYMLFKINLYGSLHMQFIGFVYATFEQISTRPSQIQDRNVDAYIYLMKIDVEKWTLLHDGGYRHGIITTNISEAFNSVLKKARVLPLKALVELIFNKLVRYFHQHCEEAQNCVHPFPTRIFDKFLWIELKSRKHKVTTYNPQEGIYIVRFPISATGTGNNVYTLQMNNKSCTCRKWQAYTLPCSHALAVCRESGTRADTYVPDIYL
ncbi:hypothetical protein M9H77_02682 [Catharanthus roseus]|uniref:Uncharacterized protein n=1 Tax=Catharanthus roseus TaxID=4058 RepID=A0ACC0C930_CATRO|nr:hypothetical protein M9H77_02682 [Catharanthus roseus]